MSVTSTNLKLNDSGQWTGEQGEGYARKYTVTYEVHCDSKQDGPATVLLAAGIPAMYAAYAVGNDSDAQALCVKRTPTLVSRTGDGGNIWSVSCEFSTQASDNQSNTDPTQWLPKISGTYSQFMKALERDIDGNPIATSADEVFDPVPEQEDSRPTLVVTKIFKSFDYVFFADYRDKVNSDTWIVRGLIFAPDYLKVQQISFQETFINGASYYEVTAAFEVKPDKWNPRTWLNAGYLAKWPTASDSAKIILDQKTNLPSTSPQRLKADGTVELNLTNPPVFVEFNTYERRPFSALNLN